MIQLYLDGHPSDVLIHLDGFPISLPFSAAGDTLTFTWDSRGANDSANIMEICAWSDGGRLGISPSRMILVANWTQNVVFSWIAPPRTQEILHFV